MLNKENRLRTRFEYKISKKYGKHLSGKYFHLYVLKPKNYQKDTKVGIVISNKVSKSAVKRNRLKRLFREAIRDNMTRLENRSLWITVYPKTSSLEKSYEEISTDVTQVLQKVPLS